jgi:D-tyrosyl-tRNA(Tyr) deacylase
MNLSLAEAGGDMLVVSQFTLLGDCRKGKRPGFTRAAKPETAIRLYKDFIEMCRNRNIRVEEGTFRAEMMVHIENDGPVTLILDSRKLF